MHQLDLWLFGSEEAVMGARILVSLVIIASGLYLVGRVLYDWFKGRK